MSMLIHWLAYAAGVFLATSLLDDVEVKGGFKGAMIVAAIFGVLNYVVGTVLFVAIGISTLLLGFVFKNVTLFVVDVLMLMLTSKLTDRLKIRGFGTAVVAGFVMSAVGSAASWLVERLG